VGRLHWGFPLQLEVESQLLIRSCRRIPLPPRAEAAEVIVEVDEEGENITRINMVVADEDAVVAVDVAVVITEEEEIRHASSNRPVVALPICNGFWNALMANNTPHIMIWKRHRIPDGSIPPWDTP